MGGISGTERIISLFVACIATGMYFVSFAHCLRWLVYTDRGWRIRKRLDWTTLSATLALFVLSSIHTSLAVSTTVEAVRNLEKGVGDSSDGKLSWTSVVMCTVTNTAVLITDGFLIYRCWLVYASSLLKIAIPSIFWVGGFVCTLLQVYWQVVQSASIKAVWTPVNMSVGPGTVLTPFWGSTIVVNVYATSMIVYRIWQSAKPQAADMPTKDLRFVIRVLIESGALYALITIPHFIVWWTSDNLAIVTLGWINLPVVCSAFNLIVIRTARRRVDMDIERARKPEVSEMYFGSATQGVLNLTSREREHDFSSNQSTLSAGSLQ